MNLINKTQKGLISSFLFSGIAILIISLAYNTNNMFLKPEDLWSEEEELILKKIYDGLQNTNNLLFYTAIIAIVLTAFLYILGNHYRKKYYVSNLIAGIVAPTVTIGMSIVAFIFNLMTYKDYSDNLALLKKQNAEFESNMKYTISVSPMIWTSIFLVIAIIISGLLIVHTILKYLNSHKDIEKVGA